MPAIILPLIMALALFALPAGAAIIPGVTCTQLGASQLSDNRTEIVACLLKTAKTGSAVTCANGGGCIWKSMSIDPSSSSNYNYEIISASNGTTYTRSHKGTVKVTYSGVSHQAGHGSEGFQYFFSGSKIAGWGPATVNYQVQSSPSYVHIAKVNGSFSVKIQHWPSLTSGRIVIEYLD